jgi:hypothetical protein
MKRLSFILVTTMIFAFISCERPADVDTATTPTTPATADTIPAIEEQSPIKGVWKCQLNGGQMTLEYGDRNVKYTSYAEFYNATAVYEGTYTIKRNEIIHEFTSLTTKNSSKIEYYSVDQLPKEAVLQDANTIIYMDYSYKRY